jgi:hypothetical protein
MHPPDKPVWMRKEWPRLVWRGHSCPRNARGKIACAENLVSPLKTCLSSLLTCAALALVPQAAAQRAASAGHAAATHASAAHPRARNGHPSAFRRNSPLVSPLTSLPFPFFGDNFNPDDIYSSGYPVAAPPPAFLMQAMQQLTGSASGPLGQAMMGQAMMGQAMNLPATHQPSSTDPLMIELQNGQYVRVNNPAINGDALPLNPTPTHAQPKPQPPIATAPMRPLPPAVLIFRDGHTEEVRDYTIADGILYARGDYYTDGYWNKKIAVATLNVPETLQANANRNVRFVLPTSPNEVITRP